MNVQAMEQYIQQVANKYTTQFNVYRDESLSNIPIDFRAEYHRSDEKYFGSKSVKVWGVENQQFVFTLKKEEVVTSEDIESLETKIVEHIGAYVPDRSEHMSTIFIGVIVTNQEVTDEVKKLAKKKRKMKFIKWGMNGWAEVYIAVVQVADKEITVHRKGKEFMTVFSHCLEEETQ
ncbi:hypothetical protein [Bacillus sp. FJAT-45350]|uniref:hypothetical protein n=1 Tax=Bacillus sp. FJAT-45350 TaxID=2011014 RepID=UPI000BB73F25|nr:hypothetical protein [Bacillus sp. FJAT-45350]